MNKPPIIIHNGPVGGPYDMPKPKLDEGMPWPVVVLEWILAGLAGVGAAALIMLAMHDPSWLPFMHPTFAGVCGTSGLTGAR